MRNKPDRKDALQGLPRPVLMAMYEPVRRVLPWMPSRIRWPVISVLWHINPYRRG